MENRARKLADEIWNTSELSDLSEFNIPLEIAITMMQDFAKQESKISINKGKYEFWKSPAGLCEVLIDKGEKGASVVGIFGTNENEAKLFADAGTTANKCGKLPSELLKERDILLHALKNAVPTLKGLLSVASEHEFINKQIAFEIDSYTELLKSIEKE